MNIFTKKHSIGFLVALLVTLNLVLVGMIWVHHLSPHRPGRFLSPEKREAEIARYFTVELNLTPEQEISLRALQKKFFAPVDALQSEVNDLRRDIINEAFNNPPDTARVKALVNKIGPKEAQKEQLLFEHFQDIRKICGPEQEKKFKSLVQELSTTARPPGPPPPPSAW